jgi:predicted AAA+ superfamily ATPase
MKDKIESIAKTSREILEKISAISFYFRVDKNSPEEVQKRESLPIQDRKQHVIDDLVAQLEKALNNQEKKGDWRRQPDAKITKLFEGIYSITESHEFKNYCERLRNLDAEEYRDII